MITIATSPLGNITTYGHDAFGNVTSITKPDGNVTGAATTHVCNADDEATSTTTPPDSGTGTGPTTTSVYNDDDTLASVTRPNAAALAGQPPMPCFGTPQASTGGGAGAAVTGCSGARRRNPGSRWRG